MNEYSFTHILRSTAPCSILTVRRVYDRKHGRKATCTGAACSPRKDKKKIFLDLNVDEIQMELGWQNRRRQIISALWADMFDGMARVRNLGKPGPKPQEKSGVALHFEILA